MKLFEKTSIKNLALKNRIVMAPVGKAAEGDGSMTQASVNYYVERAKGGAGMIIVNGMWVTDTYEKKHSLVLSQLYHVDRLYSVIEQCHGYGTKVCVQLMQGMGRLFYVDPYTAPYSAGHNRCLAFPDLMCRPMEIDQIKDLVQKTGYSAKLALSAGADAVELIVGGGYLIDEFMTPAWNDRTDEYGGSLENRMRFPLESIAAIKANIGDQIPLFIKFTPTHFLPNDRSLEEGLEMAKMLVDAGVDAIHVDIGSWDNLNNIVPSVYDRPGLAIEVAEKLKSVVPVPMLCSGKLSSDLNQTEKWLEEGKLDYVIVGRQLLADPEWPNKVREGRLNDIRTCLRCSECWRTRTSGLDVRCAINPVCSNEGSYEITGPKLDKKVLVIGGGPGGMYAAVAAADRGCQVELVEKSMQLGGRLLVAAAPDFKWEMRPYIDYMRREVAKRPNISVKFNTTLRPEDVPAGKYDKIIIATGAEVSRPPIPGIEKTLPAEEFLKGNAAAGKRIVVIGGGFVGAETAAFLKSEETHVTIMEMVDTFLNSPAEAANARAGLKKFMAEKEIEVMLGVRVTRIEDGCVVYTQGGEEKKIACDTVVNATGFKAGVGFCLAEALDGKCSDISVIGDAVKPGKTFNAVHQAHHVVRSMR